MALLTRISFAVAFGLSILLGATARAQEPASGDVFLRFAEGSELVFIGASGTPVHMEFGTRNPDGTCTPISLGDSQQYGILVRLFRDSRANDPDDAAPFRICDTDPDVECQGNGTPFGDPNAPFAQAFAQQDGVMRAQVRNALLPTVCPADLADPNEAAENSFSFTSICGAPLVPFAGNPDIMVPAGAPLDDSAENPCQGAFEDQGYGVFGEAVLADPPLWDAGDPDFTLSEEAAANIPLRVDSDDEARQNALRLHLELTGQQTVSGTVFPREILLAFEVTTGPVGGHNSGQISQVTIPLGDPNGVIGDPDGLVGSPLDTSIEEGPNLELLGAVATGTNTTTTPFEEFIVWADSVAFLDLPIEARSLTDPEPTLEDLISGLLPAGPDGTPYAVDQDDDNDGLPDDDNEGTALAVYCISSDVPNPDLGECLGGNYERGFNDALCDLADASNTDPLNPDSDGDGLPDGAVDPGDALCSGVTEPCGEDLDLDGCADSSETDATLADTDSDGLSDPEEIDRVADSDGDGDINARDLDSDDDGLCDGLLAIGPVCGPAERDSTDDTDSDGLANMIDVDSDNDGACDGAAGFLPTCVQGPDFDQLDPSSCLDTEGGVGDTCDDCSATLSTDFAPGWNIDPANDGLDTDSDVYCDAGDEDDDNDGVCDGGGAGTLPDPCIAGPDVLSTDPTHCSLDVEPDSCDDCAGTAAGNFAPGANFDSANDGLDTDSDVYCDAGDDDDDNDGVCDGGSSGSVPDLCIAGPDLLPKNPSHCNRDAEPDTCDDCAGTAIDDFAPGANFDTATDGLDTDSDLYCDAGDDDDDNDGVCDGGAAGTVPDLCIAGPDVLSTDPSHCSRDAELDTCDDCAGTAPDDFSPGANANPLSDGPDFDADFLCDAGDPDDDDDNLLDVAETKTGIFVDSNDAGSNPYDVDSDADGIEDWIEVDVFLTTYPADPDTDNDGLCDGDRDVSPQTVVAGTGPSTLRPRGIAIEASGDLVVTDPINDTVVRVDPATGIETVVSSGDNLDAPSGIAIDAAGNLLVTDSGSNAVIRIDPGSGVQTVVSSGGSLDTPRGIAIDADGDLLVTDSASHAVLRIDPVTGDQTVVSSDGLFTGSQSPFGIVIGNEGDLFVTLGNEDAVVVVDPVTGVQTILSSGGSLQGLRGIARDWAGDLFVADTLAKLLVRIDPITGDQATISSGALLIEPFDLVVDANADLMVTDSLANWIALAVPWVEETCVTGEDLDLDGIQDLNETDPTDSDSDDDTLSDGDEVLIYATDPLDDDTDADGLDDGSEVAGGSNPTDPDTDADEVCDGGNTVGAICSAGPDNCVLDPNPGQEDSEVPAGDGVGDICDNCPLDVNTDQSDLDADVLGDACDNCPFEPNPLQEDLGGVATLSDPNAAALPDGIGDVCQCGDLTADGQVRADPSGLVDPNDPSTQDSDVVVLRSWLADPNGDVFGFSLGVSEIDRCTVIAPPIGACDVVDVVVMRRAMEANPVLGPGIDQACRADNCLADPSDANRNCIPDSAE